MKSKDIGKQEKLKKELAATTRERIRKAIAGCDGFSDADIAKIAGATLDEVTQVRTLT